MSSKLLLLLLTIFLTACGGGNSGGGGDGETDLNQTFDVSLFTDITPGTKFSTDINMSSSAFSADGRYIIRADEPTLIDNEQITIIRSLVSIETETNFITTQSAMFINQSGELRYALINNEECMTQEMEKYPSSVKVDDFGSLPTLYCADGSIHDYTWRAESAGANQINFVIYIESNMYPPTEQNYIFDNQGNIVSFYASVAFDNGIVNITQK